MEIRKIKKDDAANLLKYFTQLVNTDPERTERPEDVNKITEDAERLWIESRLDKEDKKEFFALCVSNDNGNIVAEGEIEKMPRWIEKHVAEIRFAMLPDVDFIEATKNMIGELIKKAKENDIKVLLYFHLKTQKRGIEIMQDLGFEELGVVKNYYKRGDEYIDRVYLVKYLYE